MTFPGFVDCMYLDAPTTLTLDNGLGTKLAISNQGYACTAAFAAIIILHGMPS